MDEKTCEWNGKKMRKLTAKNHDNGVAFAVHIRGKMISAEVEFRINGCCLIPLKMYLYCD